MQKVLEKDARGGTRYVEMIKAHFGVTSPDARQQRPEYLGGSRIPININQVVLSSLQLWVDSPIAIAANIDFNLDSIVLSGRAFFWVLNTNSSLFCEKLIFLQSAFSDLYEIFPTLLMPLITVANLS